MKLKELKTGEMSRANICFFLGSFNTGGAEDHVYQILKNIDKKVYNPILCVFNKRGSYAQKFYDLQLPIFLFSKQSNRITRRLFYSYNLFRLVGFIKRNNIEVAHIHLVGIYLTSLVACIYAGVKKRIITWHNVYDSSVIHWDLSTLIMNIKFISRVKLSNKLATNIVAVSQKVAENNKMYYSVRNDKIAVIHNGIETNSRTHSTKISNLPKPIFTESTNTFKLIAVGSLTEQKGYFIMLRGIKKYILNSNTNLVLHIAGDGPLSKKIFGEIETLGLKENVEMLGRIDDVPQKLTEYDIYINTSFHEGFSIAILEAMRVGIPIIATSVGGTQEAILNHKTGILIKPNSTDAIANAILKLSSDKTLRESLAESAQDYFERNFTINSMMLKLYNTYSVKKG